MKLYSDICNNRASWLMDERDRFLKLKLRKRNQGLWHDLFSYYDVESASAVLQVSMSV